MEEKIAVLRLIIKQIENVIDAERENFKDGNEGKLKMIKLIIESIH